MSPDIHRSGVGTTEQKLRKLYLFTAFVLAVGISSSCLVGTALTVMSPNFSYKPWHEAYRNQNEVSHATFVGDPYNTNFLHQRWESSGSRGDLYELEVGPFAMGVDVRRQSHTIPAIDPFFFRYK